jgi:hypothetical protein
MSVYRTLLLVGYAKQVVDENEAAHVTVPTENYSHVPHVEDLLRRVWVVREAERRVEVGGYNIAGCLQCEVAGSTRSNNG